MRESGQDVAAAGTADAAFHDNSAPDPGRPTAASPFAETKRVTQGDMQNHTKTIDYNNCTSSIERGLPVY